MHIGIIGLGMVGGAIKHGFERIGHDVHGYDIKHPDTRLGDVMDTEVCFICVPTPANADGTCDVSRVENVLQDLSERSYKGLAVIKSTVIPGTTDRLAKQHPHLRIAFCPEFLREKASYTDFVENHDVCVVGAYDTDSFRLVAAAHGPLPKNTFHLTPLEAELCKYFSNVYNALRIVFANEFFEVARKINANYTNIVNAMSTHRAIGRAYLDCNEKFRGFGGSCLPKDTSAFAAFVQDLGLDLKLFQDIVSENKKFKTTIL